jgi:hypothetical protein
MPNRAPRLAPNKNTFVTVLAVISIGLKEVVCSGLFVHQPAFPMPTVKRIGTGKAEGLVARAIWLRQAKSFSTLP